MTSLHPVRRPGPTGPLAGVALLLATAALLTLVGPPVTTLRGPMADPAGWASSTPVDVAITDLAALGAWLCLAWLALGIVVVVAARAPGLVGRAAASTARRVLPGVLRRALEVGLGVAVAAGTTGGVAPSAFAQAVEASAPESGAGAGPFERPAATATDTAPTAGETPTSEIPASDALLGAPNRTEVVVVPGDSLWSIAESALGGGATDAEVDLEWRRWWAANVDAVGADPDLIHPGQRLVPPVQP